MFLPSSGTFVLGTVGQTRCVPPLPLDPNASEKLDIKETMWYCCESSTTKDLFSSKF